VHGGKGIGIHLECIVSCAVLLGVTGESFFLLAEKPSGSGHGCLLQSLRGYGGNFLGAPTVTQFVS